MWIRDISVRNQILLFSSVAGKMPTVSKFFPTFFLLLLFEGTFTSVCDDKMSQRTKKKKQKSRFFLLVLLVDGRIRIHTNDGSGFREPKNISGSTTLRNMIRNFYTGSRIQIRNTDISVIKNFPRKYVRIKDELDHFEESTQVRFFLIGVTVCFVWQMISQASAKSLLYIFTLCFCFFEPFREYGSATLLPATEPAIPLNLSDI